MNFKCAWTLDLSEPNNYEFNPEVVSKDAITKAIVYWPNGSGKSNLVLALFDIVGHLTDNTKRSDKYRIYKNLETEADRVSFEYHFKFDDHKLIYKYQKKDYEWLLLEQIFIDEKEVIHFDYQTNDGFIHLEGGDAFNLNNGSDKEKSRVKSLLGSTLLVQNEINDIFYKFGDFVDHMLMFYSLDSRGYQSFKFGSEKYHVSFWKKKVLKNFSLF